MKFFSTILLLFFTISVFSQKGLIHGKIIKRDSSFEFNYLTIIANELNIGCIPDSNGNFKMSLPSGKYTISVKGIIGMQDTVMNNISLKNSEIIELVIPYPPICPYKNMEKLCPVCKKQDKVIPIVYGFPFPRTIRKSEKGILKLGGCMTTDCDPNWFCKRDNLDF